MNFLLISLMFLMWRGFDFLIIFFSQKIIPYLGFFPYRDQLLNFDLPSWIYALANFDGLHYLSIARNGYAQYEQAFFPLYPTLIKFLSPFFSGNQLLAGLVISNVSFLIGLWVFYKYLKGLINQTPTTNFNKSPQISTIFLLLAFPTSFFFGAVYTEGLFFLLFVSVLYFLKRKNYLFVVVFAFLASLTRLVGVFLIIPIIFHWLELSFPPPIGVESRLRRESKYSWIPSFEGMTPKLILTLLAPILGLFIYCLYLWQTTGDPFFFVTSQPIFGANRSSNLILLPQVYWRYFKIFITAAHDPRFYVSIVEFLIFNFVFIVLVLDLYQILLSFPRKRESRFLWIPVFTGMTSQWNRLSLNLFSFSNLILPTLTGTFSSIPRYSLFSLSFYIYIAQIKNVFIKYIISIIFLILHILLLGYFTQGYFIS